VIGLAVTGCSSDDTSSSDTTAAGRTTSAGGPSTSSGGSTAGTAGGPGVATGTPTTTSFTAADFEGTIPCAATRAQTAGPFPSPMLIERRDVIEGRPGRPLRLGAQVVDAACEPVPGAVLEIWHCDATGDYSAYLDGNRGGTDEGEGTTFLRGSQVADADGIVEFATIYPGWYTGRAVHIHTRVHLDGDEVLTTQWYVPDDRSAAVFADAPYLGDPDTTIADDGIAGDPEADGTLVAIRDDGAGLVGTVRISVG